MDRPIERAVVVKAMAIVRRPRDRAILVSEGRDSDGSLFQRPLGGTVEFGELTAQTIEREFVEELGVRLRTTKFLSVLENLFHHQGVEGHEVVFLHEGDLEDEALYELETIPRIDGAIDVVTTWRPPDSRTPALVPKGIKVYLQEA